MRNIILSLNTKKQEGEESGGVREYNGILPLFVFKTMAGRDGGSGDLNIPAETVTTQSCHNPVLSQPSPVTTQSCHNSVLSQLSPVTTQSCHNPVLSQPSLVTTQSMSQLSPVTLARLSSLAPHTEGKFYDCEE